MARIVKVKCDRNDKHINEIDLDKALTKVVVAKSPSPPPESIPERIVRKCSHCSKGRVILTRQMIEKWLGR